MTYMSIRSEQIILRCIIYINIVVFYNLYLHTTGIVLEKRLGGFSWGAPWTPKFLEFWGPLYSLGSGDPYILGVLETPSFLGFWGPLYFWGSGDPYISIEGPKSNTFV